MLKIEKISESLCLFETAAIYPEIYSGTSICSVKSLMVFNKIHGMAAIHHRKGDYDLLNFIKEFGFTSEATESIFEGVLKWQIWLEEEALFTPSGFINRYGFPISLDKFEFLLFWYLVKNTFVGSKDNAWWSLENRCWDGFNYSLVNVVDLKLPKKLNIFITKHGKICCETKLTETMNVDALTTKMNLFLDFLSFLELNNFLLERLSSIWDSSFNMFIDQSIFSIRFDNDINDFPKSLSGIIFPGLNCLKIGTGIENDCLKYENLIPPLTDQKPRIEKSSINHTTKELNQMNQPTQIQSSVVTVTPEKAKYWLENKAPNRKVNRTDARVAGYARSMKAGEWKDLSDPIKFDSDGFLLDGQHRLLAVVKAGIPVTFVVISGYPRDSMLVMDTGKARTVHQSLTIAGVNCTSADIAVTNAMFLKPGGYSYISHYTSLLNRQIIAELFQKHSEAIKFSNKRYTHTSVACVNVAIRAAIARAYSFVDHEDLAKFLWLLDGNPGEDKRDRTPVLLRNQWLANRKKTDVALMIHCKALSAIRIFSEHCSVDKIPVATKDFFPLDDFDIKKYLKGSEES